MSDEPHNAIKTRLNGNKLIVICGGEPFRRLRDHVVADAGDTDAVDAVRAIIIEDALRWTEQKPTSWVRDRFALIGCGVIGCLVAFVLMAGLWTIVGWFR